VRAIDPHSPLLPSCWRRLDTYQSELYPPTSVHLLLPPRKLARPGRYSLGAFRTALDWVGVFAATSYGHANAELKAPLVSSPDARGCGGVGWLLLAELERPARREDVRAFGWSGGAPARASKLCEQAGYVRMALRRLPDDTPDVFHQWRSAWTAGSPVCSFPQPRREARRTHRTGASSRLMWSNSFKYGEPRRGGRAVTGSHLAGRALLRLADHAEVRSYYFPRTLPAGAEPGLAPNARSKPLLHLRTTAARLPLRLRLPCAPVSIRSITHAEALATRAGGRKSWATFF